MYGGEKVAILKYEDTIKSKKSKVAYCNCDRCGKPIKRVMYVVQNAETDYEMFYLGSECIKHI